MPSPIQDAMSMAAVFIVAMYVGISIGFVFGLLCDEGEAPDDGWD